MKSNIIVFDGENMVITSSILKEKYKDYANPLDKIRRETEKGNLIRLNRGIYETEGDTDPCLLASVILSPSYLSFDYALSYYGLIPEKVYTITSASLNVRKNRTYLNRFGRYEYSDIPEQAFSEGLVCLEKEGRSIRMASMEKAVCDSLYKWRKVQSIRDLKILLFEDKRIDEEIFENSDFELMTRLASLYHCRNTDLLIKLIRKEYTHGQRS